MEERYKVRKGGKIMKKYLIVVLGTTLILTGCGNNKYDKNEEKVKAEMKILNTYIEDREDPDIDKELEEKVLSEMSEEERAEREVEKELGMRGNITGEYEVYGIDKDTKTYVADSITKGLSIPNEGKVIKVLNGEDEDIDNEVRDDLTILMDTQKERLEGLEIRKGNQDRVDENDVNLKIISALNERKAELEEEIERRKNGEEDSSGTDLQKRISDLEKELEQLESNELLQDKGKNSKDKEGKE